LTLTATSTGFTSNTDTTDAYNVSTAPATQLIVIMPGQTHNESQTTLAAAVTGAPTAQVAGTPYTVTVKAVDAFFNTVNNYAASATISTNDPIGVVSGAQSFTNGTPAALTFTVTNKIANGNLAPAAWAITPALWRTDRECIKLVHGQRGKYGENPAHA